MLTNLTIKIDPKMKEALQKQAKKDFCSVSGLMKRAAAQYLKERGVDWENEKESD